MELEAVSLWEPGHKDFMLVAVLHLNIKKTEGVITDIEALLGIDALSVSLSLPEIPIAPESPGEVTSTEVTSSDHSTYPRFSKECQEVDYAEASNPNRVP
jgi:hypothetical protein